MDAHPPGLTHRSTTTSSSSSLVVVAVVGERQERQYRNKVRKIQRLAHAAIDHTDHIHKGANAASEDGRVLPNNEIKSNSEDDDPHNSVVYYSTMGLPTD